MKTDRNTAPSRRSGRPTILEERGLTPERIYEVYLEEGTCDKAAERLKISDRTVSKYVRSMGILPTFGRPTQTKSYRTSRPSPLLDYFVQHRGIVPRSVKKIAEETGYSPRAVSMFLSRRKKAAMDQLKELERLNEIDRLLVDTRGRKILSGNIVNYSITLDTYSLNARIAAVLKVGGAAAFVMSYRDLKKLLGASKLPGDATTPAAQHSSNPCG